ncbi:hypothetical protein [Allocoleopsis sp.]|uniref:hypothetical protein n=1 Tax=Allocoleopsis sp. TaxID=3088169 RepID=UPI002FD6F68B
MDSPWQVPLPLQEDTRHRVVVYFNNGGWIPITFYPLLDAIRFHRMALNSGMDIVVFPPDLDPRMATIAFTDAYASRMELRGHTEEPTDKYPQYSIKSRDQIKV